METDWEREKPRLEPSLTEVGALLATTAIVPLALAPILEGKANTSLRVETVDGPVLLRLLQRDPRQQANEALLAERLQGLVPAPALLAQGAGFLVYEWREGITLERALREGHNLPYGRIASQLAEVRRTLDTLLYPEAGLFNEGLVVTAGWSSAVQGYFGYVRLMVEAPARDLEYATRVEETIDRAEPRLMSIQGPPVFTHGDFKPSNLLVDRTGLTAVLDWEFAHSGTRLVDVGQLLRFPESLPSDFVRTFLDGLGLDDDAALLARTLDLTNLVDMHLSAPRDSHRQRALKSRIMHVCDLYQARFGEPP